MRRRNKRKNMFLILFMLIAFLGMGYAMVRSNLSINGMARIEETTWDIHFENIKVRSGSVALSDGDVMPTINPQNNTEVGYTLSFKEPGDFYEFTVDAVNDGTVNGMIEEISSKLNGVEISTLPAYMEYSVSYSDGIPIEENHILPAGSTHTFRIRVGFKKDINANQLPSTLTTYTHRFAVNYIQKDEHGIEKPTPPYIMATDVTDTSYFRDDTYRDNIKTIILGDEINPPANNIESWDIGEAQNGDVMAYLVVNSGDSTKYDLYIQGNGRLVANADSQYLFANLKGVDSIQNLEVLDTSNVTNMAGMFYFTGYNSQSFTLDLGNYFDTANVENMESMFQSTGWSSPVFTLNLGPNFDTSNVENMASMFNQTGYSSTVFTLDLGNKFDTSNVTTMGSMFRYAGYSSQVMTLDLGNKFNTDNVTVMSQMFNHVGFMSPVFTLNLGPNFYTSKVLNMTSMFYHVGRYSTVFTLDLGSHFDTSRVTNMTQMFSNTGYSNTNFTINFGSLFTTTSVTNMTSMFENIGYLNNNLELDLSTFDFSGVLTYTLIFNSYKASQKIYVSNSTNRDWIINNSGNSNLTSANVLIKT